MSQNYCRYYEYDKTEACFCGRTCNFESWPDSEHYVYKPYECPGTGRYFNIDRPNGCKCSECNFYDKLVEELKTSWNKSFPTLKVR